MAKDLLFVIDDDPSIRRLFRYWLKKDGYQVMDFESGEKCMEMVDKRPSAICLDVMMPGMDGIEVLKRIRDVNSNVPVIMVTVKDVVSTAVEAMKIGAYDYIVKPVDEMRLRVVVKKAMEKYALTMELNRVRGELKEKYAFKNIVGNNKKMQVVFGQIEKVLDTSISVLIQGETGTGKELVARAIHYNSARRHGPFIDINCGAIPENLQESELFGFQKGAFTGASYEKKGKLEMADGGTLFLDEISEMAHPTQVKLLRVLQERSFERIGGNKKIKVDIRIISATNKILEDAVRQGKLREDLYYRLAVYPIYVPALRERRDDIPLLVTHFLRKYQDEVAKRINTISNEAMEVLMEHDWPGNVRELENVIYQAMIASNSNTIHRDCLPTVLQFRPKVEGVREIDSKKIVPLGDIEKDAIINALKATGGNVSQAAKGLNMGRTTFYRKLERYQLHDIFPGLKNRRKGRDVP